MYKQNLIPKFLIAIILIALFTSFVGIGIVSAEVNIYKFYTEPSMPIVNGSVTIFADLINFEPGPVIPAPVIGGTVIFYMDDDIEIGRNTTGATGEAVIHYSFTPPGTYNITAYYTGDAGYGPANKTTVIVVEDDVTPPVVTNRSANPASIPADGVTTSSLNVTVTDDAKVDKPTVDLSDIGGAITPMYLLGENIWSVETNASLGTHAETYLLKVNATDINGNYNDTVSITLTIVSPTYDPYDVNQNCKIEMVELMNAISDWKLGSYDMVGLMTTIGRWKAGSY